MLTAQELTWFASLRLGQIKQVRPFANARTNRVFLLITEDARQYTFKRLNLSARDQQKRQQELAVQQLASACGLSPKVLADCGKYRVQTYIDGNILENPLTDPQAIRQLATQLHTLHQLPAEHAPQQCLTRELMQLEKQLIKPIEGKSFHSFLQLATQLDNRSKKNMLCHGDLSFNNLIRTENGQIKILDWEYAVLACPAYDLAACCAINQLNAQQGRQLIGHYSVLNKRHLNLSLSQLSHESSLYLSVFNYLNQLWAHIFE